VNNIQELVLKANKLLREVELDTDFGVKDALDYAYIIEEFLNYDLNKKIVETHVKYNGRGNRESAWLTVVE
jgi:hypothetical protein